MYLEDKRHGEELDELLQEVEGFESTLIAICAAEGLSFRLMQLGCTHKRTLKEVDLNNQFSFQTRSVVYWLLF